MYHNNSSDSSGFHLTDPLLCTGSHLRNDYVLANDVLKHVNVYQSTVHRVDFSMLFGLKGAVKSFTETEKSDEPNATQPKAHTFNFDRNRELISMIWVNGIEREIITLKNSLNDLKQILIEKNVDHNLSRTSIFYTPFMKFQRFEKEVNGQITQTMAEDWSRNTKYMVQNNRITGRIELTNNRDEQTKRVTLFDEDYNVISSMATDQKDKTSVAYETLYDYNSARNISSIKYTRHKKMSVFAGDWSKTYNFDYDADGYLVAISGPGSIKYQYDNEKNLIFRKSYNLHEEPAFDLHNDYRYDETGNWIYKRSALYRFDHGRRVHVYQKEYQRVIEYYK